MEHKSFYEEKISTVGRAVTGIAAVCGNVDLVGDKIFPGAFRKTLQERSQKIKFLWQHDASFPPVAKILEIAEIGKKDLPEKIVADNPEVQGGLLITREYFSTPRAEEIFQAVQAGAVTEMSIGYDPIKFDFQSDKSQDLVIRNLREVRLWDISDVNWGANPATVSMKIVVPYRDFGMAPESQSWEAPNFSDFSDVSNFDELNAAEKRRIMHHYAWTKNNPPESFEDLKLPHHAASKNGIGKAVWRGVVAAMAALMGARNAPDIPDADRLEVYEHLSKHYAQFDREPPEFKYVQFSNIISKIQSDEMFERKIGRVISATNLEKIKQALALLNELLLLAEPDSGELENAVQLTHKLAKRLELANKYFLMNGG